jgi:hypothetical protein
MSKEVMLGDDGSAGKASSRLWSLPQYSIPMQVVAKAAVA